ncbi:MAG TPA: acyl-CoA dehydrogenase family protein [Gemmatimonadales bacterium]|nr:acyl-CoA dehydrogenase family protein [Gemmatimonadales bacterium]
MTTALPEVGPGKAAHQADREALLATARALGPLIREHANMAEQRRRLAPEVIAGLRQSGLFRLLLPRSLGGLEVDPVTCSIVVEEIAGFDSCAGWALQAGNSGAWWSARLPTEGVMEIYGDDPSAAMSAAFHPPQQAVETAGGYRVTGRGPLASNIHDAEWIFLTALVMEGDRPRMVGEAPMVIALVLRTSEVTIVDTWHSLGMRGTDSHDVVMDGVFVPRTRTFPFTPEFEPSAHHRGPLYQLPGIAGGSFLIAPVPLAVAMGAIRELKAVAEKKTALGFTRPLRDRNTVQASVARGEAMLRAARLLYYHTLETAWGRAVRGERFTLEQKADLLLAATHAATTSAKVTDMMHRLAGTTGIYARSPLERHFRDAETLRHHGILCENRFETVGQVYLGVQPEFPLVAL